MSRIIWCFAGVLISAGLMEDAFKGPREPLISVDPTVWTIAFMLGAVAWLWLALRAALGDFR